MEIPDQSLLARQLERYRKLLFGATDPLLVEGLRKLIAELEGKVGEPPIEGAPAPAAQDGQADLFEPAS
jgi:hypothetical protein